MPDLDTVPLQILFILSAGFAIWQVWILVAGLLMMLSGRSVTVGVLPGIVAMLGLIAIVVLA